MDFEPGQCHARASKLRAGAALALPIVAILSIIISLTRKGYSLADYLSLVASGELPIVGQLLMWAALALWLARYWPSAISTFRNKACLIGVQGGVIFLSDGSKVISSEIVSIKKKAGFLSKNVVLYDNSGNRYSQQVMFSDRNIDTIVDTLNKAVSFS